MKKKCKFLPTCCLLVVYLLSTGCLGSTAFAQTPTDSPENEAIPTVTQIDNEKIRQIRDRVREKIQKKIQEIKQKGRRRAYVGKIIKLEGLQVTLDTRKGEKEIAIDKDAKIIGPKRKRLDPEDLEDFQENQIIFMGFVDPEGVMIAKRIVVIPKPPKPPKPRRAIFGQVSEIDPDSLILSLIHPRKEDVAYQVKATDQTKITKKVEGKMQKVEFSDIEPGDRIIAIGAWDEDQEILTAKLLHVIPGKAKGLAE